MLTPWTLSEISVGISAAAATIAGASAIYARKTYKDTRPDLRISFEYTREGAGLDRGLFG